MRARHHLNRRASASSSRWTGWRSRKLSRNSGGTWRAATSSSHASPRSATERASPASPACRSTTTGGSVSLRATRTGADLVAVDNGDWSLAILSATTGFFLASPAGATGTWEIHDVRTACGPFQGNASGVGGDVDRVSLDGACPVRLTLYNPGPANVTLTYQTAGMEVVTEAVAPSTTAAAAGALTRFEWTYADPTPNRVTTVTVNATIQ